MTTGTNSWQPLLAELERWSEAGSVATLWWRDDDAIAPTAALERMLGLVARHGVPLGLAVIPANATAALADRLRCEGLVDVLQHGYNHRNHAGAGERAAEFGGQRPLPVRLAEARHGWELLAPFARRTPIFVPPWNRYDADLAPGLAGFGIRGISAFADAKQLPPPMQECNCHIDIISWRTTRGFAGTDKTVAKLTEHLAARRIGATRPAASGLLSHHLAHDDGCWAFLAELFAVLDGHRAVQWLRPVELLGAARSP